MAHTENNGNGSAQKMVKAWSSWLGLVLAIILLMKDVFFAGAHEERIEDHIRFSDTRIDRLEAECARAKEMQLQLQAQKDIQQRMENIIDKQTQQIESLQEKVRR